MKILVASPLRAMSGKMHSHRSAQGVIYADQIKRSHPDDEVHCNMTGLKYVSDFNTFDVLYAYHGNDWSGSANLFGGLEGYPFTRNLANFSKFKGPIVSINIDFPDLHGQLKPRFDKFVAKKGYDALPQAWKDVDWDNLKSMSERSTTKRIEEVFSSNKLAFGDSHAICMYRPGWMIGTTPFKTLYGALKMGLETLMPEGKFSEIEVYFGNIDIRHHLLRQSDPQSATRELATSYVEACRALQKKTRANITIWELLPIENESRKLPKTGYYEGTPFYGTRFQRDQCRILFKETIKRLKWPLFEWVDPLMNQAGELDFRYMEKPQSIHLSRQFYPLWQGSEWNDAPKIEDDEEIDMSGIVDVPVESSLENFLS